MNLEQHNFDYTPLVPAKYCELSRSTLEVVKNTYFRSPDFDCKLWKIENSCTQNATAHT